ncbi:hypothetical protein H1O16_gp243 [Burkholderia phage BcepSaruman]|uniref:Uncharacterized protein n=1 Tax=Burkholderia phage BcepSaruman TaxID=2530032 RepID=A0A4D5ZDL4_9CAUD|nr:hypothetical protein H1O16_gp243 [Burkholderia phage BcepSaruman]QBX06656.1 hypothetical protein BcepSaruman_243 [Burkholderia phage BcepSaruman]
MGYNPLVLSTREEQEQADDFLMSLTQLARTTTNPQGSSPMQEIERRLAEAQAPEQNASAPAPQRVRRSRFFYSPTKSFKEAVDDAKGISEPKSLPVENGEINDRAEAYARELPVALSDKIAVIREYLLNEWAPSAFATSAATAQFMDVAQRTLGTAIDTQPMMKLQLMVDKALTVKMAEFVAKFMNLDPSQAPALADHVAPKKEAIIIHPHDDERRQRQRPAPRREREDEED